MKHTFDVVICGAGVAGIATAYYLATQHQTSNILLLDRQAPLTVTSDKSGSNYRNWWAHPALAQLCNHSIDLMDELAESHSNFFHLNRRGYIYFSHTPSPKNHTSSDKNFRHHTPDDSTYHPRELSTLDGVDHLEGAELIQGHYPFLADDIQSALHIRKAGWFSTRVLFLYLLDRAREYGVVEMRGELQGIDVRSDVKILDIATSAGIERVYTHQFVNCAGPFLTKIASMTGQTYPIYNVLHQKFDFRDERHVIPRTTPFMIFTDDIPTSHWSQAELAQLKLLNDTEPLPGNIHVKPDSQRGGDWVKMGWAVNRRQTEPLPQPNLHDDFSKLVMKASSIWIPGITHYLNDLPSPIIHTGGYYTRTAENLPIIGATEQKGMYVFGALSGFGVMVACGGGELLSRIIANKAIPEYANAFSPLRYNDPHYRSSIPTTLSGEL